MALTNNTKFRRSTLTITKKVNGEVVTTGGFPLVVSILPGFTDPSTTTVYPTITANDFAVLTDGAYNARLLGFYNYLESVHPFFVRASVSNVSSGTNATVCPLSNAPSPTITFAGDPIIGGEPLSGGTLDDHLTWTVSLIEPAPQDVFYYFDVRLKDRNSNIIRTISVNGTIRQGRITHDSYADDGHAVYLPEAYDNLMAPISLEYVSGSFNYSM
jgi:hypothetical protein